MASKKFMCGCKSTWNVLIKQWNYNPLRSYLKMAHNPNEGFCNFQYIWQPSSHYIQSICDMADSTLFTCFLFAICVC